MISADIWKSVESVAHKGGHLIVTGNIGLGKTTFLEKLYKRYPEWTKNDEPFLNDVDFEKYYALISKRQNEDLVLQTQDVIRKAFHGLNKEARPGSLIIHDRTVLDTVYFHECLSKWFGIYSEPQTISKSELLKGPVVILACCTDDVDLLMERIAKRARPGEENIPREYIELLNNNFERLVALYRQYYPNAEMHKITVSRQDSLAIPHK